MMFCYRKDSDAEEDGEREEDKEALHCSSPLRTEEGKRGAEVT